MQISKFLNPVIGVAGLLALSLSVAGVHEKIKIKVSSDSGISETIEVDDLEVGETRVIQAESGKEVLVTRQDGSLSVEVDGEIIDVVMPDLDGFHKSANIWVSDDLDGDLKLVEKDGMHVVRVGKKIEIRTDSDDLVHDHTGELHEKRVFILNKDELSSGDIDVEFLSDDVDVQALLDDLNIDVEVSGDGSSNLHEVRVIKVIKDEEDQ